MVLFHINKFSYSLMETLHIAESTSKCKQVQSITPSVFPNRNVGYFSIVYFKIHNSAKYCEYFLRRKIIETRLTKSSH